MRGRRTSLTQEMARSGTPPFSAVTCARCSGSTNCGTLWASVPGGDFTVSVRPPIPTPRAAFGVSPIVLRVGSVACTLARTRSQRRRRLGVVCSTSCAHP